MSKSLLFKLSLLNPNRLLFSAVLSLVIAPVICLAALTWYRGGNDDLKYADLALTAAVLLPCAALLLYDYACSPHRRAFNLHLIAKLTCWSALWAIPTLSIIASLLWPDFEIPGVAAGCFLIGWALCLPLPAHPESRLFSSLKAQSVRQASALVGCLLLVSVVLVFISWLTPSRMGLPS